MNEKKGKKYGEALRQLPGVDLVIQHRKIPGLISLHGHELVTYSIRKVIGDIRHEVMAGGKNPGMDRMVEDVCRMVNGFVHPSLRKVINATGIIIHTNLGRAPMGEKVLNDVKDIILGYSNLEFDLKSATRGRRNDHVTFLLKYITGAEDAVVVNNNAAGLVLALNTLADGKEIIISRGELVEIGGSFRIPEIIASSGAKMIEVGTTNRTRLSDYEKAVNAETALILKVHKSNYAIKGFTEEAALKDLVKLAHSKKLPVLYDIGSGLLRKPEKLQLDNEPDIRTAVGQGADMVAFSGDKLLGGPQSGIVAGKKKYISRLAVSPLMRALRVDKFTIAALSSVIRSYLNDDRLTESLPLFSMLERSDEELQKNAGLLLNEITGRGIEGKIVDSTGQCGGGSLPEIRLKSYAVALTGRDKKGKGRMLQPEKIFRSLIDQDCPVIGVLRRGELLFDVLTLDPGDFPFIADAVSEAMKPE